MKPQILLIAIFVSLLTATASATGNHTQGHQPEISAIGQPGKPAKVNRTVTLTMSDDMRFTPSSIRVRKDETIRFVVKNIGKIKHEMVLGTEQELKEHNELMKKNPEMEHADDNQVSVQAGRSGKILWQFSQNGKVNFACLQPGHYEAGMKGAILVGSTAKQVPNNVEAAPRILATSSVKLVQKTTPTDMAEGEVRETQAWRQDKVQGSKR